MPAHEVALPVTATALNIIQRNQVYPILLDTDTFDRAGEDGDIPILPLNGGDVYVGEVLEGHWHKGWDANIRFFSATVSGDTLRMTGIAAVTGIAGYGWINSYHPVPLLDDLELTVSMEVPVDDTGVVANQDIYYNFLLKQDKDETRPTSDNNYLRIYSDVDESGIIYYLSKNVNGTVTVLFSGSTYDDASVRATGDFEATIWRVVFDGKPGTAGAQMYVYLKQGATLAAAEAADEYELTTSPYDLSGLAICVAYPAYEIYTQNSTYFGTTYSSVNRAASTYLRIAYPPQFTLKYDYTEANYGDGDVTLWDGDPDSGGVRVYDEDHAFNDMPYVKNGLIMIRFLSNAFYLYSYISGVFTRLNDVFNFYTQISALTLAYPHLLKITKISTEQVILKVKFTDTSTNDNNVFSTFNLILNRGKHGICLENVEIPPLKSLDSA